MGQGYAIIIAWPETKCKQAGAWYDPIMRLLKISEEGYYKVGHAAVVLVDDSNGSCHYFDFGRYHSPFGHGRVRNAETDHDLAINVNIQFGQMGILNLDELIIELNENRSCHGDGLARVGIIKVHFKNAFKHAKELQSRGFIPYGPFVLKGTNCSRFVRSVALKGMSFSLQKMKMSIPPMITPTPLWNVKATGEYRLENQSIKLTQQTI